MPSIHFEELWEQCEKFHKQLAEDTKSSDILDELNMKVSLYKLIDTKENLSTEEKNKLKSFTLGEILLTLTGVSLIDNINVYEALQIALKYKSVDFYNTKYSE